MPGPLTVAEFLELWKSVTEPGYHRPILEQSEGGREFFEQAFAQYERASIAVDRSTQEMFVLPWSGQTAEPAGGGRRATVEVQITRQPNALVPPSQHVVFAAGQVMLEQAVNDWSPTGPVEVLTGRRYVVRDDAVLGYGELGPVTVTLVSEYEGQGYNLPPEGTIKRFVQPGSGVSSDDAVLSNPNDAQNLLTLGASADFLAPAHVGQHIRLTAPPSLAGKVRRIVGFISGPSGLEGGRVLLDVIGRYAYSSGTGTFIIGEEATQASSGARCKVVHVGPFVVLLETIEGTLLTSTSSSPTQGEIVGSSSGATLIIEVIEEPALLPPTTGVAWEVLSWEGDEGLGLVVFNPEPPSGGRHAMLDALGSERGVPRAQQELDDDYRERVARPADVVAPNALLRAANRILAPLGHRACLREVGYPKLRGFFYDGDPTSSDPDIAFAYDLDPGIRPADRWKVLLSFFEFRAFFLIGVPEVSVGDFGFAYDEGAHDTSAFDGFPVGTAAFYSTIWSALNRAHGGGVLFDLYVERDGCV